MCVPKFPNLVISCEECHGNGGSYQNTSTWTECKVCDGRGHVPSEFGQQVIDFVRAYVQ